MEDLLKIMQYAHDQIVKNNNTPVEPRDEQWDDGAAHGALDGRISAYKDVIRQAAKIIHDEI